jgi:phage terminase small subunit
MNLKENHGHQAKPEKPYKPRPPLQSLTHKQKIFVNNIVDKGMTKTDAYINAYDHNGTRKTAYEEASRTARTPQVLIELAKHSSVAENTLITVMQASKDYALEGGRDGASYASVAVQTANSILDRVHGKATQRIEQQSTAVVIQIDLTGVAHQEK